MVRGTLIPLDNKGDTFYNSSNLIYASENTAGQVKIISNKFEFNPTNVITSRVTFWTERV